MMVFTHLQNVEKYSNFSLTYCFSKIIHLPHTISILNINFLNLAFIFSILTDKVIKHDVDSFIFIDEILAILVQIQQIKINVHLVYTMSFPKPQK